MINDLKDLEKFFKICRKHGLKDVVLPGGLKAVFGDLPGVLDTSDEATSDGPLTLSDADIAASLGLLG